MLPKKSSKTAFVVHPIAIGFKSDAFPTPARINTDIDKDYILLEGEAGAHHAVEGGGAGGGCRS